MALAGAIPIATADPGASHEKVFVCKYVGQPKVDERLQSGGNPIDVSLSSVEAQTGVPFKGLGSYFADAHGQSFVLAWADKGTPEPPVTDCPAPRGPVPVVTSEDTTSCTTYSTRTITTPFVLEDDEWVPGQPVYGAWVNSTPTAQQLKDADLDCRPRQPDQPDPTVTDKAVISTTCTAFTTTTTTTTTPYVLADGKWVLGAPVVTTGKPVISTPTAGQITAAGLDCATPDTPVIVLGVSTTATPKSTKPANSSVSVLGVPATANPLPAGASAGEADTSGQAAAGGLTGLAALFAFGAAFILSRPRGVACLAEAAPRH